MPSLRATPSRKDSDNRVSVLLPLPIKGTYDYRVPLGMLALPGSFVSVPFGKRELKGVVWGEADYSVDAEKLKDINEILNFPCMTKELRQLIDWAASYTLNSPGTILRMAMSTSTALDKPSTLTAYLSSEMVRNKKIDSRIKMTAARKRILDVLFDGFPRSAADLSRRAKTTPAVISGMTKVGLLKKVYIEKKISISQPNYKKLGKILSPAQKTASSILVAAINQNNKTKDFIPPVTFLDGVTGSGKTEVYFEAIAAALAKHQQILVLLPEIALTAQWLMQFTQRFGAMPLEWHSDLTNTQRRENWRAIVGGDAKVIVGARSALFLPYPTLGLIIVDEEHDSSFKQEEGIFYNARDMAIVRGHLGKFPVILVSATPSLETVTNVKLGRYNTVCLPERHGSAILPKISAIDMRYEKMEKANWLAPVLQVAIEKKLLVGEQVMLFLNRRGYAPLTLCRSCGHRLKCPDCTSWLVDHKLQGIVSCHHCGFTIHSPNECPECEMTGTMVACGPGVERLSEEVLNKFPNARTAIMASDTIQRPSAMASLVEQMQKREIDILIGTQIMAKGHHFPYLTLVGVIDADLGLSGGDLRAAERTFQLLHQVAGRAGRALHPGEVFLQTFRPKDAVMQALISGARDQILSAESEDRRVHGMPPYGRLVALIVSGPNSREVETTARALGRTYPNLEKVFVFGPAPAPLSILRGQHRWRLLLKAERTKNVQVILRNWLSKVKVPNRVRVKVDVDPYSFL